MDPEKQNVPLPEKEEFIYTLTPDPGWYRASVPTAKPVPQEKEPAQPPKSTGKKWILAVCAALFLVLIVALSLYGNQPPQAEQSQMMGSTGSNTPAPVDRSEAAESNTLAPTSQPETTVTTPKYKLLMSNAFYTAPFSSAFHEAAIAAAEKRGCTLEILDGEANSQIQLEHVNKAITEGYDGFIFFPTDVDSALPAIETLNASGITWIGASFYDGNNINEIGMSSYIGPDLEIMSHRLCEAMIALYPSGANYVTIKGAAYHPWSTGLTQAFPLRLDGSKYVSLDSQYGEFNPQVAQSKTENFLQTYGLTCDGGKIDAIIVQESIMLPGVINALQSYGYAPGDVSIITTHSNQEVYNAMMAGWVSATVTVDPNEEGSGASAFLIQLLEGTTAPSRVSLNHDIAYPETAYLYTWF